VPDQRERFLHAAQVGHAVINNRQQVSRPIFLNPQISQIAADSVTRQQGENIAR
jgi:hypothetical protein